MPRTRTPSSPSRAAWRRPWRPPSRPCPTRAGTSRAPSRPSPTSPAPPVGGRIGAALFRSRPPPSRARSPRRPRPRRAGGGAPGPPPGPLRPARRSPRAPSRAVPRIGRSARTGNPRGGPPGRSSPGAGGASPPVARCDAGAWRSDPPARVRVQGRDPRRRERATAKKGERERRQPRGPRAAGDGAGGGLLHPREGAHDLRVRPTEVHPAREHLHDRTVGGDDGGDERVRGHREGGRRRGGGARRGGGEAVGAPHGAGPVPEGGAAHRRERRPPFDEDHVALPEQFEDELRPPVEREDDDPVEPVLLDPLDPRVVEVLPERRGKRGG